MFIGMFQYNFNLFFAAAKAAQRVFRINMLFPSSVLCNEAGQGVLRQRVRNAVNTLNRCVQNILSHSEFF